MLISEFYVNRRERRVVRTECDQRTFTVRPRESALRIYVFVSCLAVSVTLFVFSAMLHVIRNEIAADLYLLTQLLIASLQNLAIFALWSQLYGERGERISTHLNLCLFFGSKLAFWFMLCVSMLTNVTLEDTLSYLSALDWNFKTVFDLGATIVLGKMEFDVGILMLTYHLEWGRRGLVVANKMYHCLASSNHKLTF